MIKKLKNSVKSFKITKHVVYIVLSLGFLVFGLALIWLGTLRIPDFKSFDTRKVENSTKIYDRTGQVLLYDVHQDYKRTVVPFDLMGTDIKNATVAIEDSEFYQHKGIRVKSIIRAIVSNVFHLGKTQGGSTITQQIVKNTLLTQDKTIARKLKEWVLALKVEKVMNKEQILEIYLNEAPYGGSVYGIQEASQTFFKKNPVDLTLAQSAYLAAIPNAPTFFSPYGKNKAKLDDRKNVVLARMKELGFINQADYDKAKAENVEFFPQETKGIKAPHFVMYIKDYLTQKYGTQKIEEGGLKVITTLDWNIEQKGEEVVKKNALINKSSWNAENESMVIMNPKTGEILSMIGSRDYFDKEIDGNFNVALAHRQPGSSFKPFVYATAFKKGFTPETVLFDVPTEFNPGCNPYGKANKGTLQSSCYMPDDFDTNFKGPMELRDALGQSRNIPAVKLLYLTGVDESLKTARDMGIKSLGNADLYGLSLVLGGGEVSLLDLTSAYGVFANSGNKMPVQKIIKITDSSGQTLEEMPDAETLPTLGSQVIDKNVALTISDLLSDNVARTPTFGANSTLKIPGRQVAVKTGTTNNNKDGWMMGYTPSLVIGVWSGNNANTPMKKGSVISGPTFNEMMQFALKDTPDETFETPYKGDNYASLPPMLRGSWQGGESYYTDKFSKLLATDLTPNEAKVEHVVGETHDILYWIDKDNPTVSKTIPGDSDNQFKNWETAFQNWWATHKNNYPSSNYEVKPTLYDNVHTQASQPNGLFVFPSSTTVIPKSSTFNTSIQVSGFYPITKVDYFINGVYVDSVKSSPFSLGINLNNFSSTGSTYTIKALITDSVFNKKEVNTTFSTN